MDSIAMRPLPIRRPEILVERRPDGSFILTQAYDPPPAHRSIAHLFAQRAAEYPDRTYLARRAPLPDGAWGDWRRLSYATAWGQARAIAQRLLDLGMGPDRPVLILSGPSLEHGAMVLGAYGAQAPVTVLATAYSLVADDFGKLRHAFATCRPGLVFVEGPEFEPALEALPLDGVHLVSTRPLHGFPSILFDDLIRTRATDGVDRSVAAIGPNTVARYIFTSGSTGAPKAVIHTHGSLCAQIASRNGLLADPAEEGGSQRLSWQPWNHIGGVIQINYTIQDGGAYHIDEGRPIPGMFDQTLRNLREIIPSEFISVPVLYGHLVEALEADDTLCHRFFENVRYLSYGSAAMSTDIFDRLQSLAIRTIGVALPFCTKYGTTEVQAVTHSARPMERPGEIGVPYPGARIKLAPHGDKLEMRVKGAMVTPGYLGGADVNAGVFDEDGYFCTGDAAAFIDPTDPGEGLLFDGRVTENFKLSSGSWVSVGALRVALIEALAPLVQDCVIAGQDRDFVAVLAWTRPNAAVPLSGLPGESPLAEHLASEGVRRFVADRLGTRNAIERGSSRTVRRLLFLTDPPNGDEQAEKGYINQRAALTRRAAFVEALYAEPVSDGVIAAADAVSAPA